MDGITERLALLALDNGQRMLTETVDLRLGYGLCGALILDLMLAGALKAEADSGNLMPQPQAELHKPYLQEAFAAIPSHTAMDWGAMIRAFYAVLPGLKERVFEALMEGGYVWEDTAPLKWSFAFKTYILKREYAGYRTRLFGELQQGSILPHDALALRVADACGLLQEYGKKEWQAARPYLRNLEDNTGQVRELIAHLADTLPQTITRSHKLTRMGKKSGYAATWEWRGFWREKGGPTVIRAGEEYASLPERAESEITDHYILVEGMPDNIKCRKSSLEIKRPQETLDGYTAFSAKRTYDFPLSPEELADIFPRIGDRGRPVKSVRALCQLLNECGMHAERIEVKKKRFQVRLKSCVKVEFCALRVGGQKYLAACVEGPDYAVTQAHSQNFRKGEVREMGYVEFLKHCRMENAL